MHEKIIQNKKVIALVLTSIILFSSYAPFLAEYLNRFNQPNSNIGDPNLADYLYEHNVDKTTYNFKAVGECFVVVEIEDINFTEFILDNQLYTVSYGLNIIPVDFSNPTHELYIQFSDLQYFKSLTVEPLILAAGTLETSKTQDKVINFQAGGPISILVRPTFAYNWLYVELKNASGGSTLLKRIHDTADYPEIDPLFYCLFVERGSYIRYDITLEPGANELILRGDGQVEYKILVNSDWDRDYLNDIDEVQQTDMYVDFDLDPTVPDIWGFFEKSAETVLDISIEEEDATEGFFSFYIPETFISTQLAIEVNSGEFKDFVIDDDYSFLEGEVLISDRTSPPDSVVYGELKAGWHYISYTHKANYTSEITFLINNNPIKVLTFAELKDTDGDGIKDVQENANGLDPSKLDTDEDGIPDNLDASPLAKIELDPQKIYEVVVPTDLNDDTIIDLQIKKPINDYSTNGNSRMWRETFNVSIYPVLRIFGNRQEVTPGNRIPINRQQLSNLYGKNISLLFNSDPSYSVWGLGDSLPTRDPDDWDSEVHFIFPKPAMESISYSIKIPHGHSSKNDERLHLRFDIIWLVTRYDSKTDQTSLLHYYDFEEPIIVQTMTKRELSNVEYLLGNPDCFIENQILWTLTQNPTLGTPGEFGVSEDIVGSGNVNSFDLGYHTAQDRMNTPLKANETEILYLSGSFQNYDILNKIHLKTLSDPDFATTHQGDFEVHFSSYAISNLYEDQEYFMGDSEIQGENKILYQIYHHEISENNDVKRASIMGIPVAMELYANSKVLKISYAQGFNIPLDQIPWEDSQLGNRITLQHLTYIERDNPNPGIPFIHFDPSVDICKEFVDNWIDEVEHSNLFFTSQPHIPAESFQSFISEYWTQVNSIEMSMSLLSDLVSSTSFTSLKESITLIMAKIDNFEQFSFSDLNSYNEFFQFTQILQQDTSMLIASFTELEEQGSVSFDFAEMFLGITMNCAEEITVISEYFDEKLVTKLELLENDQGAEDDITKLKAKIRKVRLYLFCTGVICAALGVLMIISGIQELIQLAAGQGELSDHEYAMRLAKAIGITIAGTLLTVESLLLIASSLKTAWASALSKAITFLGVLALVVSAVLFLLDSITFFEALYAGEVGAAEVANFVMGALSLASTAMIVAGGALLGAGIVLGLSIALAFFLVWLIDHLCNDPHITVLDDLTKVSFPSQTETNLRRNGGLEVGDDVNFRLVVDNDGKNPFWMRGQFMVFGDGWEGTNEGWKGSWDDVNWYSAYGDIDYDESFTSKITEATPELQFRLKFEADYREYSFWDDIWGDGYSRVEAVRETVEQSLNIPVLENSISDFYSQTDIYFSYASLLLQFNTALEKYKYKDAFEFTRETQLRVERSRLLTLEQFEVLPFYNLDAFIYLNPELEEYYLLTAYTETEFFWLMYNHYKDGWRATTPNSAYKDDFNANLFGYSNSSGPSSVLLIPGCILYRGNPYNTTFPIFYGIYVPKIWVNSAETEFSAVKDLLQLGYDLPIKTNIETDLAETSFDLRPVTGIVNVSLNLLLDGPPECQQKEVIFEIIPPEGFSISPQNQFTGLLSSSIDFTLIHDSGPIVLGAYFFEVKVYLDPEYLIYKDTVPMLIEGYSLVEFIQYEATDSIIPGDYFQAIDVINLGTYEEVINITVEGIPDSFIYRGIYPNPTFGDIFPLELEETRIAFMIHPPRHYSTSPGLYTYIFRAQDHVFGSFDETIKGTFEVAEFYDMDFHCINPEITILDYQMGTYSFELTNLGNVPQEFYLSSDDIPFADECLSDDIVCLGPGETQTFTLTLTPKGLGEQEFSIHAISEGNSSTIICKISINDDDVNPPEISEFEIIDTPIDVTVKFNVWNEIEGDDRGLSNIKIFIDDELILEYIPDPMETCFSFTFNDTHGFWFMENGTHEIRVELIDNDFDVPNDALGSSISGTFETELVDMYLYVDWQIEVLKNYTDTHLCWLLDKLLSHKLYIAQKHLEKAYHLAEQGELTCGLFHDAVAKIMIEITEFRTEIFNKINFISDEDATYIIDCLHTIRNNIVLLLGTTSEKEHGIPLASIEINLLNLNDFIEDKIDWWSRKYLTYNIDSATKSLEIAIFLASMDCHFECILSCAQWKLELAKKKVNCLLNKGKISQDLAETIIFELEQAQNDIEIIKNSL